MANSPDIQIRRTQAAALKEKFLKTLRRYQASESEARKKYQGRMERQYKIGMLSPILLLSLHLLLSIYKSLTIFLCHYYYLVKPDASPQEIERALESDNQQIFAQSVSTLL